MNIEIKKIAPILFEIGYHTTYTICSSTYLGTNYTKTITAGIVVTVSLIEKWCTSYFKKDPLLLPWEPSHFSREFFSTKTKVELVLTPILAAAVSFGAQLIFLEKTPFLSREIMVISLSTTISKFTTIALKIFYRVTNHSDLFNEYKRNVEKEFRDLKYEEKFLTSQFQEILKEKSEAQTDSDLFEKANINDKTTEGYKISRKTIILESIQKRINKFSLKIESLDENLLNKQNHLVNLREKMEIHKSTEACIFGTVLLSCALNTIPFLLKKTLG